jgi:hypothetical protein
VFSKDRTVKKTHFTRIMALLCLSNTVIADIVLDESIIVMSDSGQSKHDVTVYNNDDTSNLYLEVTPYRVLNPGEDNESLEPLSLDTAPEFLVSPNRVIVPPSSATILRLLNLTRERSEERVYRINLIPASPPLELQQEQQDAVASVLQVLIAYQILVIIPPENPNPLISNSREGSTATFYNTGNANYLLTDGEQCNPADLSQCVALESKRIYPGNNWHVDLPFNSPGSYTVRTDSGSTKVVF